MKRGKPLRRSSQPLRRTPLNRGSSSLKRGSFNKNRTPEDTAKMNQFFLDLWDERQDADGNCYCFETDRRMPRSVYREITACYDHVLEKNQNAYPQYAYVKRNIIIVLPSVHAQKGMMLDHVPKIKAYREELLTLHRAGALNDET